jgi:nicotinate-nucleotide adenylyltransferase
VTDTSASERLAEPREARSIGILGGTFNPPHLGHLAVARRAREELGADRVLLMPAHTSPNKATAQDPGPRHRMRMSELLVEGAEGLLACPLEIERGGVSYTVDTLNAIHASHPDAELTLIVGADTANTLAAWREPAKLLELADLAVAARTGSAREEVLDTLGRLSDPAGRDPTAPRVRFLQMPTIAISSSEARRRAARGEPIEDLVGPAVAGYVAEHGLYRSAAGESS